MAEPFMEDRAGSVRLEACLLVARAGPPGYEDAALLGVLVPGAALGR
jgi:hypothetical protein